MQMTACVRLCLVVLRALAPEPSLAITLRTKVTPVQKLSELLQNLIVKATVEKGTETQVHSEFAIKTNDAISELGYKLEKLNTRIHVQEADQESAEAELGHTQKRLTDAGASNVLISHLCVKLNLVEVPITGKVDQSPRAVGCFSEAKR